VSITERTKASTGVSRLRLLQWVNLLAAPLLIVGFVLVEASTGSSLRTVGELVVVGLVGSGILAVFFALAGWGVKAFPWGESWGSILVILITGGVLRALSLEGGLAIFGLVDDVLFVTRLLNSMVLIPVTLGLALRGLEFLQRYRRRRDRLIRLLAEGEQQLRRQVLPTAEVEKSLMETVERDLAAVNDSLANSLLETKRLLRGDSATNASLGLMRDQADQQWRSLSHRLWEQSATPVPRMSGRELVNTVALLRPLSLGYLGVGTFFLFALALVRLFPLTEALLWSAGWFALMALASILLNEIPRHVKRPALTLALLLIPYTLGGGVFLIGPGVPAGQGWGATGIHATIALSMVLIGAGPAVSQSQDRILAALRRLVEVQALERIHVESEASILAQKFAERLHSDIRGAFHARMMRLQKCIDEGQLQEAEKEIDALVEALRENQATLAEPASIEDLLVFLRHWDGIVTITSSIDGRVVPPHLIEPVTTIVTNAVNDAVRHGGAENISVSFQPDTDFALLRITNDGAEFRVSGPDGLGHASLDRLAPGAWERTRVSGVTVLSVSFPGNF